MKYLLSFEGAKFPFQDADKSRLEAARTGLERLLASGAIDCCYTNVGGGGFLVLNAPDHAAAMRMVRQMREKLGVETAVTPLIDTREVLAELANGAEEEPEWVKTYLRA